MVETSENKWYVIRAVSGKESKIKDYIMTEITRLGFQDHIEEILVPTEKVIQIRNGKKINKEKVYFPGYIMIKANLVGEVPHIIRSVTNVIGFLGETKGGDPVPLRISEVNRMLGKVDELALNCLQNSIIFKPAAPRAGPTGGDGFAAPPLTCNFKILSTSLAII